MERRRAKRRIRRLRARYRPRGSRDWYTGFTTNISATGLFLATGKLQTRGTRVRIELIDPSCDFAVEGVVRWARQVPPALRSITSAGFGVRFLDVDELMRPLVDADRRQAARQLEPEGTPPGIRVRPAGSSPALGAGPRERRPDPRPPAAGAPGVPAPVYSVDLKCPRRFLDRFESELIDGVLFVETSRLLDAQSPVTVELALPPPHGALRMNGYVVLRLDGGAPGSGGKEGIAIEVLDRRSTLAQLQQVVTALEALDGP